MKSTLIFTLLAVTFGCSCAAPFDLNDLFLGRNAPVDRETPQDVVKRQVLSNADGQLKQVSFQTLIGSLENSLFQSALSLNGASAAGSEVVEVKPVAAIEPLESNEHSISKRSEDAVSTTAAPAEADGSQERKILLQTTKKVPLSDESGPAHLIIDRVSVLPQNGVSVPLIPTFQVHHTKITSATITEDANKDSSDGKQTKISITKTSITSTAPVESVEAQSTSASTSTTTEKATTSESSSSSSTTTTTPSSTTTTSTTTAADQPIVKLKQVEEKLKAKVAEVEAEPVILTARV
ncbi:A-agglutinin anchorage subunit isoform X3 [Drosophila navojoa]|uniref:A-agglutinin anchorage subunit isoform X3 n=1 Tax=Drosophila navojoa TaxID=7232 RepID=UPI000847B5C4|nr:A-agglutinin anchorage subunit isoform X3 [Drosophila navojoa]